MPEMRSAYRGERINDLSSVSRQVRHDFLVSHQSNFKIPGYPIVFMIVTKCGNTSIKYALGEALGLNLPPVDSLKTFSDMNKVYAAVHTALEPITKEETIGMLKVSVVRNPVSRIVSCYKHKVLDGLHDTFRKYGIYRNMPFDDFLECINVPNADKHFRSIYSQIGNIPDYIGRLEDIDHDWKNIQTLCEDRGFKLPSLKKINTSRSTFKPNEKQIERIKEIYLQDFESYYPENVCLE